MDFHLLVKDLIPDSFNNTNTEIIIRNNRRGVFIEEWEKLETMASNALFYFIIYNILFHVFYLLFFHLISCNFIIIIN